jgi:hypothetical protein
MNEHDDVICQVRESFSGLRMDMPVQKIFAQSHARRRRQFAGLTMAAAATAGIVAATTLTLGGPAPAGSSKPPPPSPGPVNLAAFSVTNGPGNNTTLVLRKGPQYRLDPAALRQALARHGIPALVTVGTFCRSRHGATASSGQIKHPSDRPGGTAIVLNAHTMPPGTRLSIGYFPGYVRMALITDGAPLTCSSSSHQPAAHITPSGTPIRGQQ